MARMNHCTFIGHLGRDPSLREVGDDVVCSFSVAVNAFKKDDPPLWINVSAWGKQAEPCAQYLAKGHAVCVAGELSLREYEGNDGEKRTSVDLRASQVVFLGGREQQGGEEPADSFAPKDDEELF